MNNRDLKNIYIYDAATADKIFFCGREIKQSGKAPPKKPVIVEGVRVHFFEDFASAAALGIDQRLDIAAVNMSQHRGSRLEIQYLGVAGVFPLEISEVS